MSDLVKRAREWLLSSEYNLRETTDLVRDMREEIERLRMTHFSHRFRKAVLDDMREWGGVETPNGWMAGFDHRMLDAYEKERLDGKE